MASQSVKTNSIQDLLQPKKFDLIHYKPNEQNQNKSSYRSSRLRNLTADFRQTQWQKNSIGQSNLPTGIQPNHPPQTPPRGGLPFQMRQIRISLNKKKSDIEQVEVAAAQSQGRNTFYETNYSSDFLNHSTNQKNPYVIKTQGFHNVRTIKKDPYKVELPADSASQAQQKKPLEEIKSVSNLQEKSLVEDQNLENQLYRKRAQTAHQTGERKKLNENQEVPAPFEEQENKENFVHGRTIRGNSAFFENNHNASQVSFAQSDTQYKTLDHQQGNDQCFDIDYSFLDNVSINDPKLKKILKQDMIFNKSIALNTMLDENPDYFHHIFGNCACFKCSCGDCQCNFTKIQLSFKNGMTTHNNKEYWEKQSKTAEIPPLNQENYESLADLKRNQQIFDPNHLTTHNYFYKNKDPQPRYKRQTQYLPNHPFMATTSYNNQFKNWQEYDPQWVFRRPDHVSVVGNDYPMDKNTAYGTFFSEKSQVTPNATADDVKRLQKNSVIDDLYKDGKPTTNSSLYTNFQIKDVPNTYLPFQWHTQTLQPQLIPTFEEQFKSTHSNDFKGNQKDPCQAKRNGMTKPWKAQLINKLKAFQEANSEAAAHNPSTKI